MTHHPGMGAVNVGNRTSKTNQLPGGPAENYTYDPIHQLTQVLQGMTTTESYSYDAVGNRLSSLGVSPYTYNASNQFTSTPGATYTYDNNGNTLTKTDASGTTTYAWDFENRLTSVTLPSGAARLGQGDGGRQQGGRGSGKRSGGCRSGGESEPPALGECGEESGNWRLEI